MYEYVIRMESCPSHYYFQKSICLIVKYGACSTYCMITYLKTKPISEEKRKKSNCKILNNKYFFNKIEHCSYLGVVLLGEREQLPQKYLSSCLLHILLHLLYAIYHHMLFGCNPSIITFGVKRKSCNQKNKH
jgi:hypothetical protein